MAADFIAQEVVPAFEAVKAQLAKGGRAVQVHVGSDSAHLVVQYQGEEELDYTVVCHVRLGYAVAVPETRAYDEHGTRYVAQGYFRAGAQDYVCQDLMREEIRQHLLSEYKSSMDYTQRRKNRS